LEPIHSSALNNFEGLIREISDEGLVSRIIVDSKIPFVVIVTKNSYQTMQLKPGKKVYLSFKATAVHVFDRE